MTDPLLREGGELRYTSRIDFAVGLDMLIAAARELLDDRFGDATFGEAPDSEYVGCEESLDDAIDRFLGSLNRSIIDQTVRDGLRRGGYQWLETIDDVLNGSLMAVAGDRPARRVSELFPELVR